MDNFLKIKVEKTFAVIGDVHGCFVEFKALVEKIRKEYGKNTLIISVGDTVDRGDYNIKTVEYCFSLKKEGYFIEVQSNHNYKFYRWLKGRNVNVSHGLQKTINEFLSLEEKEREIFKEKFIKYYEECPLYLIVETPKDDVIVAHAGIKDEMIGKVNKRIKAFVLYGETTGKFTEKGFPERLDWTKDRVVKPDSPKIVYGHVVYDEPYINNKCYGIDTGCVLGNKLTAYLPLEEKFIFEKARKTYFSFD
ncbi:MAG: metallophosphoesterase [Aquificae bacterium]|nr:metallophosphoesterase [Aquificota bacterium]